MLELSLLDQLDHYWYSIFSNHVNLDVRRGLRFLVFHFRELSFLCDLLNDIQCVSGGVSHCILYAECNSQLVHCLYYQLYFHSSISHQHNGYYGLFSAL